MSDPLHHSMSSVKKWGGSIADYLPIHAWFDESKAHHGDFRHRALRHHAEGIAEMMVVFGRTLIVGNTKEIPTRWVGEQHVNEDLGCVPTVSDWLRQIEPQPWMNRSRRLSKELEREKIDMDADVLPSDHRGAPH